MDILNKLKSSLSSSVTNTIQNTVYHSGNIISGVIPGMYSEMLTVLSIVGLPKRKKQIVDATASVANPN
jgi:TPP-dependent 2-oxoacid decarboxylase